ncbi:MAG: fused signal recognition particle receptor [Gammaproteobacteria bacterium]|jgi:fused signal recognition particle receptor
MFGFKSGDKKKDIDPQKSKGMFSSLRERLAKTRSNLSSGLANILLGKKRIDNDLLEQLEDQLLLADIGLPTTQKITSTLTASLNRKQLNNGETVLSVLKQVMSDVLQPSAIPLNIDTQHKPYVILMVGINGAGKTTTVGKLAQKLKSEGHRVMLSAGDTFRAAAVEQLQTWGDRLDIPVIQQGQGADSASVIFDALQSAQARNIDVLIADTAGRLHTQSNLMEELKKIKRVLSKLDPTAPHETMLVLDAGTGQNAIVQAAQFKESVGVTGITLTKLDGTAKGGMIFSVAEQLKLPIRFIGVGEAVEDLRIFDSDEFVDALLNEFES